MPTDLGTGLVPSSPEVTADQIAGAQALEQAAQISEAAEAQGSPMPGSKEGSCCSSLKAVVQTSTSAVYGKPALLPVPFLYVPIETHAASLALLQSPPNQRAISCDRVLVPEVCLGPAFQSNAPPDLG